ncbi:LysR family transcriptional regulator [Pelagibacterium lacus]|uniref:LysR family transcriptional regulator n=1 Tax=Pelagibacterium lacus TaxID=2282655 RepID=A0A369W2A8_9HYPH|nr:LysR family transcriptional regulator [Pelagibacterium lacus]RDE08503.1 LysR family transcriptional regulator [Pelagibacterium lacus]
MDRLESDKMFVAVMETGSFTAAAARLGTSSGQASKLVSRLESELGVRLLSRTTRAVSPTEAGQAYFDRLRPLLEEFDNLDAAIRDASHSPRGKLRLTAPLSFGTTELAAALNAFAAEFDEIELDVSFSDRLVNLVDEGFDMAVRVGMPNDSSVIARKLYNVRIMVVGAPAYLDRRGEPSSPDDLSRFDCIIDTNFKDPSRWPFRTAQGEPMAVPVEGRIRYSNAEACRMAAEAGLGLACLPDFIAAEALRAGRLRRVLEAFDPEPYPVHALYPHSRHLAAKVRVLVDFLIARYRDRPH